MSVYTETHVVVAIIIINYKEDERSDDQRVIQVYLACIHACNYYSSNQTFFLRSLSAPSLLAAFPRNTTVLREV